MAKKILESLENEAVLQLGEIRTLREERSPKNFEENIKRAKVACVVVGSYVRLRATMANEETNRLVSKRLSGK